MGNYALKEVYRPFLGADASKENNAISIPTKNRYTTHTTPAFLVQARA
jgi:hypothetical protein